VTIRMRLLVCLIIICLLPLQVFGEASVVSAPLTRMSSARNGMVRVFLSSLGNPSTLNITVQGSYTVGGDTSSPLKSGDKVKVGFSSSTGKLTLTRSGVTKDMGSSFTLTRHSATASSGLLIAETKNPSNPYPGDLKFKVEKSGSSYKLYTIASIYIEYYLYGVLPYEMGNSAHREALKSQAVAARTYTLNKMNQRASSLYDVVDTTNDQVYRGTPSGDANCKAAVDATKGIVVMNGSSLTSTYYTASNGGQTESAANAWGSSSQYSYLKVKDDPFDLQAVGAQKRKLTVYADYDASAQSSALKSLLLQKAKSKLSSMGYQSSSTSIQTITNVYPHTTKYASPSRLYTKMDFSLKTQVKNSNGVWQNVTVTVTCDIFSELESSLGMSINSSKNELWSVSKSGGNFIMTARRFGHGVGMSQQGAMQMGNMGYTYDEILGFYYTGCKWVQYAFTHTVMSPVSEGGSTVITTTENPADIGEDSDSSTAVVDLVNQSDRLGIRSGAGTSYTVIGSVPNGAPVRVYAINGSWCFIGYGELKGYVQLSGLSYSGDAPAQTDEKPTAINRFATVTASGSLNLRAEPNSGSSRLGSAPQGAVLSVFSVSNGWAYVQYGAIAAYASADYLRFSDTYPAAVTNPGQITATVQLDNSSETVNFRSTPSTGAAIIAKLRHGTKVNLIKNDGSWCYVSYNGNNGYIMSDYLRITEAADDENEDSSTQSGRMVKIIKTAALHTDTSTETYQIALIPAGTAVECLETDGDWAKVVYNGETGYVMLECIDENSGDDYRYATVTTQSGSLNMRSKPKTGSVVLTTIPRNAHVKVLSAGEWSMVTYGGYTGYVLSSFLTFEEVEEDTPEDGKAPMLTATVTTQSGSLNLRESPESWAEVLIRIPQYTRISILEKVGSWSKTTYGGCTGYVMNSYLTFDETDVPSDEDEEAETQPDELKAQVITQSGSLNLRTQPKSSAEIKRTIPRMAWVAVIERGEEWSKVSYQGIDGYVMSKFVVFKSDAEKEEATDKPDNTPSVFEPLEADKPAWVYTDDGTDLNFRFEPGGKVLMTIPYGDRVMVIEQEGEWTKILYEDAVGYVMSKYLTDGEVAKKPQSTPKPTPKPTQKPTPKPTQAPSKPQIVLDPTLEELEYSIPAQVTAQDGLNLRDYCSKDAKVLLEIPADAYVRVIQEGEEWCQVIYEEETGYCMTKYLKLILW